jgi:predicted nucleic acid-binding protein
VRSTKERRGRSSRGFFEEDPLVKALRLIEDVEKSLKIDDDQFRESMNKARDGSISSNDSLILAQRKLHQEHRPDTPQKIQGRKSKIASHSGQKKKAVKLAKI